MKIIGIYKLINKINNKIYIGKSIDIKSRMASHKNSGNFENNSIICKAIKKYGWENFNVEILETFNDITNEELLKKESEWIKKLDTTNSKIGYNILEYGADWTGFHHSEETKRKISESAKERYGGENNPMYGKNHSEETKRKISETRIKNKIGIGKNNPFYGKKQKEEFLITKRKKVKQIDIKTGEIIKIWDSMKEAAIFLTGDAIKYKNISQCCCGGSKSAYGYKWEILK